MCCRYSIAKPLRRRRIRLRPALVITAALLASPSLVQAEEAGLKTGKSGAVTDSEHIFGFTEGTDIGEQGEHEIEVTFVGNFGKVGWKLIGFDDSLNFHTPFGAYDV